MGQLKTNSLVFVFFERDQLKGLVHLIARTVFILDTKIKSANATNSFLRKHAIKESEHICTWLARLSQSRSRSRHSRLVAHTVFGASFMSGFASWVRTYSDQ